MRPLLVLALLALPALAEARPAARLVLSCTLCADAAPGYPSVPADEPPPPPPPPLPAGVDPTIPPLPSSAYPPPPAPPPLTTAPVLSSAEKALLDQIAQLDLKLRRHEQELPVATILLLGGAVVGFSVGLPLGFVGLILLTVPNAGTAAAVFGIIGGAITLLSVAAVVLAVSAQSDRQDERNRIVEQRNDLQRQLDAMRPRPVSAREAPSVPVFAFAF